MFYIYYYLRDKDSKIANRGTPYYVGKGHGKRCYSKDHRIKVPGNPKNIVKVIENIQDEEIAYRLEEEHVRMHGRVDMGNGILRNLSWGGERPPRCTELDPKTEKERKRKISINNPRYFKGRNGPLHPRYGKIGYWRGKSHPNKGRKVPPNQVANIKKGAQKRLARWYANPDYDNWRKEVNKKQSKSLLKTFMARRKNDGRFNKEMVIHIRKRELTGVEYAKLYQIDETTVINIRKGRGAWKKFIEEEK